MENLKVKQQARLQESQNNSKDIQRSQKLKKNAGIVIGPKRSSSRGGEDLCNIDSKCTEKVRRVE
jgi:hypothetical protein